MPKAAPRSLRLKRWAGQIVAHDVLRLASLRTPGVPYEIAPPYRTPRAGEKLLINDEVWIVNAVIDRALSDGTAVLVCTRYLDHAIQLFPEGKVQGILSVRPRPS